MGAFKKTIVTKTSDGVILKETILMVKIFRGMNLIVFNLVISKRKKFHLKKLVSFSSDFRAQIYLL